MSKSPPVKPIEDEPRDERRHREGRPSSAARTRDFGLRRISRLTRWAAAAAIALTGTFSEVAAHAWSGRSHGSKTSAARRPPPSSSSSSSTIQPPPSAGDGEQSAGADPSLQPPEQVPQSSAATGGAVSGGS